MRVLMISDVYFPRVNGVSTSIQTFRRDLDAIGCESWLIVPAYPGPWNDDGHVMRQPSRYLILDPEDRIMVGRAAYAACRELQGRVDVMHVQTPFIAHRIGVRAARAMRLPAVETYHTFFEEYLHHYLPVVPRRALGALARTVSRRQCDAVDAVIAPSRPMADVLHGYGVRSPIEVLPTGLDLREFAGGDGARFRARHGVPAQRPVLLVVGRVAHEKNLGFLVRVLARVRATVADALLVIAGEGPARKALQREISAAGLGHNVLFVGYLDRRDGLLDCYRAADAFVFASRTETQGLVLLEALALGVPVISTAVLGTRDVLDGAGGAIVVDEDVGAFANAAVTLLGDRVRRGELGRAGARYVAERWSSQAMARRLLGLYERVANVRHEPS